MANVCLKVELNYESQQAKIFSSTRNSEDYFWAARHLLVAGAEELKKDIPADEFEETITNLFVAIAVRAAKGAQDDKIEVFD